MRWPRARTIFASAVSALIVLAAAPQRGAAVAGPVDGSGVIHGCYTSQELNGSHVFFLQDAGTSCPKGTTAITWNQQRPAGTAGPAGPPGQQGPEGPAGSFTGHFASPDGLFSIDVTDTGIVMTGPSGRVAINSTGVSVQGSVISLNGCNTRVARTGDAIDPTGLSATTPGGPVIGIATINQGSPTVCTG